MAKCKGRYAWLGLLKMRGQAAPIALYRDGRRALFRDGGAALRAAVVTGGADAVGYDVRRVCVGRTARLE